MYLISLFALILYLSYCELHFTGGTVHNKFCRHDNNVTLICNYIPNNIPSGTLIFRLNLYTSDTLHIEQTTFKEDDWRRLQYLELTDKINTQRTHVVFKDGCFKGLEALRELHIHVWYPELFKDTFSGLTYANTLDLRGCGNITMGQLSLALNRSGILPGLQRLILANWNVYEGSYAIDDEFVEMLLPRNITYLDVSNSQISKLNTTSLFRKLTALEFLNSSYTIISDISSNRLTQLDIKHIKLLDLTRAILPKKSMPFLPGKIYIRNKTVDYSNLLNGALTYVLTPDTVNYSGIVPQQSSIWLENITLKVNEDPLWDTKTLIIRQNNLKQIDVMTLCEEFYFASVETFDISDNGMEFLHPTFLACLRNMKSLHLSGNQLFKMVEENSSLFQELISNLKYLRFINLSANELKKIPSNFFQVGKYIEKIDLSFNTLEQVTFSLTGLGNLKSLDLRHNNIHILNPLSIHYLTSVHALNLKIILKSNPISCSVCAAKPFLTWLITTDLIDATSQSLKCSSETGKLEDINNNSIKLVEKICVRKTVIISTSVSAAIAVLFQVTCILLIYKRYKRKQKNQIRANVINNLKQGDGHYQFAAFLSFSSEDEDFVKAFILAQLNEHMHRMTGIERNLVCTGDEHFRPGFYVHNEAFRQLDNAAVVVVVVSNNFCASEYCRNELDQAYVKRKPIILMFIEHVEADLMMPTMKELYQRNVRILWTIENGEHVLKTSWENVCTSILDLVKC